jgi:hypothetical protein
MSAIPAASVAIVWKRARSRCEFCRLHQKESRLTFHIDHVIPKQHGGSDCVENLCLSCSHCNWQKGPNLAGLLNGKIYPLFNPRRQIWQRHFEWDQTILVGKTGCGIVTVQVLDVNSENRIALRETLLFEGRFPPDGD